MDSFSYIYTNKVLRICISYSKKLWVGRWKEQANEFVLLTELSLPTSPSVFVLCETNVIVGYPGKRNYNSIKLDGDKITELPTSPGGNTTSMLLPTNQLLLGCSSNNTCKPSP